MRIHLVTPFLVLLAACSTATTGLDPSYASSPPPDPGPLTPVPNVKVVQEESLGCATEVLGTVDVHEEMKSEDQALAVLKRRAAALGAEAVVGVEFHHGEGGHEATHLSGMAVRCNDMIHGRRYEVIGNLDVPGEMEHEDEAFAALKSRAHEMNADLIIAVHFEHGEGEGQPSHLTGKAIRFVAAAESSLR